MARKWLTLGAVCTGVFMLLLDITIVNVALPDIQRDLDASLSDLQWVIDAYALTLAALQLTAGSTTTRAPFTITAIVNQSLGLIAPDQKYRGKTYAFVSWSDGGAQTHTIRAPSAATTYTATYQRMR